MLIEFSVKNFRSIKGLQTISLVAAPIKSRNQEIDISNTISYTDELSFLKSAAIYGANGSGKSNMILAMIHMLIVTRDLMKDDTLLEKLYNPFALNVRTIEEPTYFQIQFITHGKKFRYGFEFDQERIVSEWLFGPAEKKEVYYFKRDLDNIQININQFKEGKDLEDKTIPENLFLNVAKTFNGKISKSIKDYFSKNISISGGVTDFGLRNVTLGMMKNESLKDKILDLLNVADFGIDDIIEEEIELDQENRIEKLVFSKRPVFDDRGERSGTFRMPMDGSESEGTRKVFNYAGAILRALRNGLTLVLDEFDARLHPSLTKRIVEMFNSNLNEMGAQLIFTTHDTNLLDPDLLRRDQIYFAEKNSRFETCFYSLYDFKGIRNDASYEKDYIKGKYGAIPYLGDIEKVLD
jgi:AAA15 family ATPase/GTPase